MEINTFVEDYALNWYRFNEKIDVESKFIANLIFKYMKGERILDLGCGPVVPISSIFYENAKEIVCVDLSQENIDFIDKFYYKVNHIVDEAKLYKEKYFTKKKIAPKIQLICGSVTNYLPELGTFDCIMNMGCFGSLNSNDEFEAAVSNAYKYLKEDGTLLMINWIGDVSRPFNFNGKVDEEDIYIPALKNAGFKIDELHIQSDILSQETKDMGYKKIIWAIAKK